MSSKSCKLSQKCCNTKEQLEQTPGLWCILLRDPKATPRFTGFVGVVVSPELEQIRREAECLTGEMSQADWHHVPPGKWSCAQIFEHLLLSYASTTKETLKAMEIGKPLGSRPRLRDRISTFYVSGLGLMPLGRMAAEHTMPTNGVGLDSLRQFNDALVAMDATLADAERRFGTKVNLLDHPVLGPLTAQQWRRFHRTHAKHHFRQIAERLKSNAQEDS